MTNPQDNEDPASITSSNAAPLAEQIRDFTVENVSQPQPVASEGINPSAVSTEGASKGAYDVSAKEVGNDKKSEVGGFNQNIQRDGGPDEDEDEDEDESDDEFPRFGDTARGPLTSQVAGQKKTSNRPR